MMVVGSVLTKDWDYFDKFDSVNESNGGLDSRREQYILNPLS
jgi:hypothetical protein